MLMEREHKHKLWIVLVILFVCQTDLMLLFDTICLPNRFNVLDDFHADNKSSLTPNKGFSKGESKQSGKSKIKKSKCKISNNDMHFNNFNRAIIPKVSFLLVLRHS